ncbi:hypothetical protein [Burkholderia multivorans]|uniref:hypothetical protein n=1 Tax=Burkholderia multivorans TaxID=87883 RepID=UPI0020B2733D|nr:hypothetical protein [Burkholderia multivorans]
MATQNDFLPFATGPGANVVDQATYAALSALTTGFLSGTAQSTQLNKVWRQSSIVAAVIAQFIVAQTGQAAVDDGTTATLLANFTKAVGAASNKMGLFLGVQVFTSSGTYTPGTYMIGGQSVTATKAKVRGIGAGGAGGSCASTTSSQGAAGSGGNAGAYGEIWIASGLTTQPVTIGAPGAPSAAGANAGGAGGASSFGTLAIFGGGAGGLGGVASPTPFAVIPSASQASCSGTGAFIVAGRGAVAKQSFGISTGVVNGSSGADTLFGSGGQGAGGGAGTAASGYGAGGGGAGVGATGTQNVGGAGAPGLIIVEEYA